MKRHIFVLGLFLAACDGAVQDGARGETPQTSPSAPGAPSPEPSAELPRESCNGVDDDGDPSTTEPALCRAACDASALASLPLDLPREGTNTVAPGSGVTPELTAITKLPTFCTEAAEGVTRTEDAVDVGCGAVLSVDRSGLRARTLRIATGGVVRVTEDAAISVTDTILVCPGATIQASADSVRVSPASVDLFHGHHLSIAARVLLVLGAIEARGGMVVGDDRARGGDGGDLDVEVERLLFAGSIDNSAGTRFNHGEAAGDLRIVATKESFFSGTIRSTGGSGYIDVPVM